MTKACQHLAIIPYAHVGLPHSVATKLEVDNCTGYKFPLLELKDPNLFQHDNAAVHKASSMVNSRFTKAELEDLERTAQSPTEHLPRKMEVIINE